MQSLDSFFFGLAKSNEIVDARHLAVYNTIAKKVNGILGDKVSEISLVNYELNLMRYSVFRTYLINLFGLLQPYFEIKAQKLSLINTDEIAMFPARLVERLREADLCYQNGYSTAACALCGTVVEAIIIETVGKTKEQTWEDVICTFCKKYDLEHDESLVDQLKDWRNKANHLSSLNFDDKRAAIFINSLLVIGKKVYEKK